MAPAKGVAKYGAYAIREQIVKDVFARGEPPLPFSFPANTISGATLFLKCRTVSKRKVVSACVVAVAVVVAV